MDKIINAHANLSPLGSKSMIFKGIPVKIFDEHRTAFYHWGNWHIKNKNKPNLITFDYHQDYGCASDIPEGLKKFFEQYGQVDAFSLSYATSFLLDQENDSQIEAAAKHNYIDSIFALHTKEEYKKNCISDCHGHKVFPEWEIKDFINTILSEENLGHNDIYLDIDLDYFTIEEGARKDITLCKKEEIIKKLKCIKKHILMNDYYQICGITIATEPRCCGSIKNSNEILNLLDEYLFDSNLLRMDCEYD